MTKQPGSTDAVVIERHVDAPVELVWQMWTVPEHFAAWYGPGGASVSVSEMDVRVGGRRLVGMQVDTPQGTRQMWFAGEFREVVENKRLVYTDAMSDEHGNVAPSGAEVGDSHATTEVHVELDDVDGRTRMVLTHIGIPSDSPGAAGWAVALDKFAALVARLSEA